MICTPIHTLPLIFAFQEYNYDNQRLHIILDRLHTQVGHLAVGLHTPMFSLEENDRKRDRN